MTVVAIVIWLAFAAVIAVVIAVDYATPLVRAWLHRREVVRRSAIDHEMQAMRAAQQLSFMAWRARREMYDIASRGRASRSGHPVKHD